MNAIQFDKKAFDQAITAEKKTALVDFWASWCGPCRMLAPVVEELADAYQGRVTVAKVNVDEQPDLAQAYAVSSIPTLILFKNGEPALRLVGVQPKAEIARRIDALL